MQGGILMFHDMEVSLDFWAGDDAGRRQVAAVMTAMSGAVREIATLVARGALAGSVGATIANRGAGNDQKELDVLANDVILRTLAGTAVAAVASEELDEPHVLDPGGALVVGTDPIDGSTNIDANLSIGTIFTVLPALAPGGTATCFLQPGTQQLAACFALYGPQTTMTMTLGAGTHTYTLDPATGRFIETVRHVQIPLDTAEFAINISNYRHWDASMRTYIEDCLRGADGPRGKDFNMRWTASPVADIQRILSRGGIYLYPGDAREGFGEGRLRLIYEANPLAFIIEQAGGAAWSGRDRILDLKPKSLHQRVPLMLGSRDEVAYAARLLSDPHAPIERSPLFARRGLFRL
jgi:fructose-1,6-bisphosphatase I